MFDYEEEHPERIKTLAEWIRVWKLNPIDHISHGIETMPDALADLYLGNNVAVRTVQVGEPS